MSAASVKYHAGLSEVCNLLYKMCRNELKGILDLFYQYRLKDYRLKCKNITPYTFHVKINL